MSFTFNHVQQGTYKKGNYSSGTMAQVCFNSGLFAAFASPLLLQHSSLMWLSLGNVKKSYPET